MRRRQIWQQQREANESSKEIQASTATVEAEATHAEEKRVLACPNCGKTGRGLHFHMKACKG